MVEKGLNEMSFAYRVLANSNAARASFDENAVAILERSFLGAHHPKNKMGSGTSLLALSTPNIGYTPQFPK